MGATAVGSDSLATDVIGLPRVRLVVNFIAYLLASVLLLLVCGIHMKVILALVSLWHPFEINRYSSLFI